MSRPNVVVLGGGTGTSVVLSGLKKYDLDLTAIFVVSDSGGSTGRLRDEFGFMPVGDARQCLVALASGEAQQDVRKLLLYRFGKGKGLEGHNLGNLILTALEDMESSPARAIETAANIFSVVGEVYPITEKTVDLVVTYQDGTVKIGEHNLDLESLGGKKIKKISLSPRASIYSKAKKAIKTADMVVLGPGDLYGSLLPNTVVRGFKKALKSRKGKFVYIVNLMTHYSQTHNMSAQDHVDEVKAYCGVIPDVVIMNNGEISNSQLKTYAQQKEYPVKDDLSQDKKYQLIRQELVDTTKFKQDPNDKLRRSVLRHDRQKLANLLKDLLTD